MKKIVVVGLGYVGLSNATLLAVHNSVIAVDINKEKVDLVNNRVSPITDKELSDYFQNKKLHLTATLDLDFALPSADYVVIATPTDYDDSKNSFDTSSVDGVVEQVNKVNNKAIVIIKSTLPVGHTTKLQTRFPKLDIAFSPEFLREGRALHDNLYPSRIVVGGNSKRTIDFAELLKAGAIKKDVEVLITNPSEAEAIKLFSNTYLAMRVAFFNELDTFAEIRGLDTKQIIKGVSLDPRIGDYYNNPSFGYGGYCLPKDTKQLLVNYEGVPQDLMSAIVSSNRTRKDHIINMILHKKPRTVGINRLLMKNGSDNIRSSSVLEIAFRLHELGKSIYIYEPLIKFNKYNNFLMVENIDELLDKSDVIISNRVPLDFAKQHKIIYSRDIFGND